LIIPLAKKAKAKGKKKEFVVFTTIFIRQHLKGDLLLHTDNINFFSGQFYLLQQELTSIGYHTQILERLFCFNVHLTNKLCQGIY
jgi:hypothetical protein